MSSESAFPVVSSALAARMVGRYLMYDVIASGGMASVHFGRLRGEVGFSRTVAIKHLHPHYSSDTEFISMFLDEARLAARIQHPNVAAPLDVVVEDDGEIFLVMEYIHGDTLVRLITSARSSNQVIPLSVSASIMSGALHGLHAAHEAVDETGQPLGIIHRDVSPQNIMVGVDGVARMLDFGVAKAVSRCQSTRQGHLKGKLSYMAPEQMRTGPVDRRVDVFAAGIVLWEALTQQRLFKPDDPAAAFSMILDAPIDPPSTVNHDVPATLDQVVMKALDRNVATRFQTALEFADALEEAVPLASHRKVGDWVQRLCGTHLAEQARRVSDIERSSSDPDSSKDAEAFLRARRGSMPVSPVDPTGSTADLVPASWPRTRSHQSALSRAEIPPSPSPDESRIEVTPDRKTWPLVVAATVVVLLVGAGGFYWLRGAGRATKVGFTPGHFVSASASTMAPPSQPAPLPPPAAQPAPVVEQPAHVAEDTNSAARAPAPAAQSGPRRIVGTPGRHKAKAKPAPVKVSRGKKPPGKIDCDPPYYVDYQGIRRVKPQCF